MLGTGVCGALLAGADGALALMGADAASGQLHDFAKEYLMVRCANRRGALGRTGPGLVRA